MELVINRCYGGFGLSALAVSEYLKRKGKECFIYSDENIGIGKFYRKTQIENANIFSTYTTKDFGKTTTWDEIKEHVFYPNNIDREDLDLIYVVKKLGNKANGTCSELKIVEIPDGIEFELSEYDGLETVEEKHRSWY